MTKKILVAALLLSISFTACSNAASPTKQSSQAGSKSNAAASSAESFKPDTSKPVTIDIFRIAHPSSTLNGIPKEGFPADLEVEKKFNCKLNVRYVPNASSTEVYNTMMASGNISTIVQNTFSNLDKYADAWVTLNDYIVGKYKNLQKQYFDDSMIFAQTAMSNGNVKILSSLYTQKQGDVLLVRGDLVKKYGIDIEKVNTKEEWYDLFKKIKASEPNTVAYGTRYKRLGLTNRLSEGWSGINEDFFVEGDQVKYGALDSRLFDVITWLRQLYSEGLIDKDYPTSDTTKWQEKVLGNGIFLTHDNPSSRIDWADNQWKSLNITDRYYQSVSPLAPAKGKAGYTTFQYPSFQDSWAISQKADKVTVDRIMQIFDYGFTEDGHELFNWGIEGLYFDYDKGGAPIMRPEYSDYNLGNKGIALCFPRFVYNPLQFTTNDRVSATVQRYEKGGLIKPNYVQILRLTEAQLKVVNSRYPDIQTFMNENLDGFIVGTKDFNKTTWTAFTDGLKKLGIDEVLKAYNEAFQVSKKLLKK